MKIKELAERLLFVRRCVGCGEILDFERFDSAFCPLCEMSFRSSMTESCSVCYQSAVECRCMPEILSKSGALTLRRITFYDSTRFGEPRNKLVYYLKRHRNSRVTGFVARELRKLVSEETEILEIDGEELFTVNIPRKRGTVSKYGHDQAELIAKALAKELNAPYYPILKRRFGGKEQKKLTAKQRVKNVRSLITLSAPTNNSNYKGKYAVLVDDISTTGASLAAAAELLRKGGVRGVICVCIATTPEKKPKSKGEKQSARQIPLAIYRK